MGVKMASRNKKSVFLRDTKALPKPCLYTDIREEFYKVYDKGRNPLNRKKFSKEDKEQLKKIQVVLATGRF